MINKANKTNMAEFYEVFEYEEDDYSSASRSGSGSSRSGSGSSRSGSSRSGSGSGSGSSRSGSGSGTSEESESDEEFVPIDPIVVDTHKDQERAGGTRWGLATEIAGQSQLAKTQDRFNRMDPDIRLSTQLEHSIEEIRQYYSLSTSDREHLLSLLMFKLPNKYYKNPQMLVLGYILQQTISRHGIRMIRRILQDMQTSIVETDVIRYYRLLETIHLQ